MRPRHRSAAAVAALAAASVPLWPSVAAAGGDPPDEFHTAIRTVAVGGVDCQIRLTSSRSGRDVFGATEVISTDDQCRTNQVFVNVEFVTEHGDTVSASSADQGPASTVAGSGATDLVRTFHGVTFTAGPSANYTMASK
jgi:hypothetical protein